MKFVDQHVLEELEFPEILLEVSAHCATNSAREKTAHLKPFFNHKALENELKQVNEMLTVISYDNLPAFASTELLDEIVLLRIENSMLSEPALMNISDVSQSINGIINFLEKKKDIYPNLNLRIKKVYHTQEIVLAIDKVLDRAGKVKSSASKELERIRKHIDQTQSALNKVFGQELHRLKKEGYLGDTNESFVNGRRVLSVQSEYKRKVAGHVMGISNTGKLTYIEPAQTIALNNELTILENEERLEINRILRELTAYLRNYLPLIEAYQELIVILDLLRAKARYASEINAVLPQLSDEPGIYLVKAYHPILLKKNISRGIKTHAQTMSLGENNRMMVISGPNAGGKSITLKTIGLLQLMLQSGLLVPCKDYSRFSFFDKILTDIGDNQSIENELSTYSHRLTQMKNILKTGNAKTLVLIDEFGTGSDPELGGALAEVFFQELHRKKCFGVITTHYMNIKVMADKLDGVSNACMLFDKESLSPKYELSVGQPGSSFTFEVAEKIGIELRVINEAKKRVKGDKLKLDSSIAELQKAKADVDDLKQRLRDAEAKAVSTTKNQLDKSELYDEKFHNLQELIQLNNRYIQYGRRFLMFLEEFDETKTAKKELIDKVFKLVTLEKAKQNERAKKENVEKVARTKNKKSLKRIVKEEFIPKPVVLGGNVRMNDGTVTGVVKELQKDQATVLFGDFLTKVKIKNLVGI